MGGGRKAKRQSPTLPARLAGLKPGDPALLHLSGAPPFDKSFVDAALRAIRPPADQLTLCREKLVIAIQLMRMIFWHDHEVHKRTLSQLKLSAAKTARLLDKLGPGHLHFLLPPDDLKKVELVGDPGMFVAKDSKVRPSARLQKDLRNLVANLDGISRKAKSGALKMSVALSAYDFLMERGSANPTLSSDGPFFNLASILYEAVTGRENVSIEWHCRRVLRMERAKSSTHLG
jgi:hypothetical protein